MTFRPDHRRVLDNLDYGWPAETVTWAQAEYDAELRGRQPDDPGAPPRKTGGTTPRTGRKGGAWDDLDRHALRAPVRPLDAAEPSWLIPLLVLSAGITIGAALVALFAMAWGL